MEMERPAITPSEETAPLKVLPPVTRRSNTLGAGKFLKAVFIPFIITAVGGAVGYATGHFMPSSLEVLSKASKKLKVPMEWTKQSLASRTAAIAGIYSAFRVWKKDEKKRLGVQDIHKDMLTELDPKEFKVQLEQNEHIQDNLRAFNVPSRGIEPRGSYTEAAIKQNDSSPTIGI